MTLRKQTFGIASDDHSWRVAEVKRHENGGAAGQEYFDRKSYSYFTSMAGVADHLFEVSLRRADVDSLAELVRIGRELRDEIRALFYEQPETVPKLAVARGGRP